MSNSRRPEDVFSGFRDTSRNETSREETAPSPSPEADRPPAAPRPEEPPSGRKTANRGTSDRETSDRETSDRETSNPRSPDEGSPEAGLASSDVGENEDSGGKQSPEHGPGDPEKQRAWKEAIGLYEDGNPKKARLVAARLAMEEQTLTTPPFSEELYVWDPEMGVYVPDGEDVLSEILARKLGPYHSTGEVRQVEAKVRALAPTGGFRDSAVIPLANGDLPIEPPEVPAPTELLAPSPQRRFLARSEASWDPAAECPALKDLLRRAVPSPEERQVLQDYAGYSLMGWARPYRRALVLAGPAERAQELFLQALRWAVPSVASTEPGRLARKTRRSRGARKALRGAWANACPDPDIEALAELPVFQGTPSQGAAKHVKHIYSVRELPTAPARRLFRRRVLLARFPETLAGEKLRRSFERQLWGERDGILQWALEGLRRVLAAVEEEEGFPSGRGPKATQRRWEAFSGPIGRFKAARLEVTDDADDVVPVSTVHSRYETFCDEQEVLAEKKDMLTRRLTEDPRIERRKRVPKSGAEQVRCYVGLQLKDS